MICSYCGEAFTSKTKWQRFCSTRCRAAWEVRRPKQHLPEFTCQHCGKIYHPKAADRIKYCSRHCSFAAKHDKAEAVAQAQAIIRKAGKHCICKVCSQGFKTSRSRVICSDECRKKLARQKEYARNLRNHDASLVTCKECGTAFTPIYGDKKRDYCSDSCGHKRNGRIAKAQRRARVRSLPREAVDPIDIFKRDRWHCKLCGRSTPRRLRGSISPDAPELDHIVPIAHNGSHTRLNLQCLCRESNQAKGATTAGQLVMV